MKTTDAPIHDGVLAQSNQVGRARALVECFGVWSNLTQDWQVVDGLVFSSPSKAVAWAQVKYFQQTQNRVLESSASSFSETVIADRDWELYVRSFDEWAESEGLTENSGNDPEQPPKQIPGLPNARFSGKVNKDGVPIYYVPFPGANEELIE